MGTLKAHSRRARIVHRARIDAQARRAHALWNNTISFTPIVVTVERLPSTQLWLAPLRDMLAPFRDMLATIRGWFD